MTYITRLPQVYSDNIVGQGELAPRAAEFAEVWLDRLGQRRDKMTRDSRLVNAAQRQAEWLAVNDFDERDPHLGENGSTANARVHASGYKLPMWHGLGNTVESVTRNWSKDMAKIVDSLLASPSHAEHLFGRGFFEDSTVWGIGNAAEYFVVLAAPVEGE